MRARALAVPVVLLALLTAGCSAADDEVSAETTVEAVAEATTAEDATDAPVERTDLTVFIEEPAPLSIFTMDDFVCTTHAEVADILEDVPAPRVQLYDGAGELLATQEVDGTGPTGGHTCSMFVTFLDVPVAESYRAEFSGEDGDGMTYEFEESVEFDQGKFDEGYTQGIWFEL